MRFFMATDEEGRVFIVQAELKSQVKKKVFAFLRDKGEERKSSSPCQVEPLPFEGGVAEIEQR